MGILNNALKKPAQIQSLMKICILAIPSILYLCEIWTHLGGSLVTTAWHPDTEGSCEYIE